jgi:hypothetical protein
MKTIQGCRDSRYSSSRPSFPIRRGRPRACRVPEATVAAVYDRRIVNSTVGSAEVCVLGVPLRFFGGKSQGYARPAPAPGWLAQSESFRQLVSDADAAQSYALRPPGRQLPTPVAGRYPK